MGCGASKKDEKKKDEKPEPPGYKPYKRGPFPCGVMSITKPDAERPGRSVTCEIYYPAAESARGLDAVDEKLKKYDVFLPFANLPATEQKALGQAAVRNAEPLPSMEFPTVVYSHGEFGHRRGAHYLMTHMASHGFIMVAFDCQGDTWEDLIHDSNPRFSGDPRSLRPNWRLGDRIGDFEFVINNLLSGDLGVPKTSIRPNSLGVMGHGIGASAAIVIAKRNHRVNALFALAPNMGIAPLANNEVRIVSEEKFTRAVPAFYMCAKMDSFQPFNDYVRDHFKKQFDEVMKYAPPPLTKLIAIDKAGFFHFVNDTAQHHESLRKDWVALKVPGINGDGNQIVYDYKMITTATPPIEQLHAEREVQAVIVSLATAFMHSQLLDNDDANTMIYQLLQKRIGNVDLEIISA